jgi:hypothetical protein
MSGRDDVRPASPGVKLTYDDYVHLPEDGRRHELIDGEHFVTPTPNRKHQAVSLNLSAMIWNHLQAHSTGRLFTAPFDVMLTTPLLPGLELPLAKIFED